MTIDLGLKTEQLGLVELTTDEALDLIEKLVAATAMVRRANT
jgi:hypothetical protein